MLWTLFFTRKDTLVTFGDALSSWLDEPDEFTRHRCLISERDVVHRSAAWSVNREEIPPPIAPSNDDIQMWRHAVSSLRWIWVLSISIIALVAAAIFFRMGVGTALPGSQDTIGSLGFGKVNPRTLAQTRLPQYGTSGSIASALLANTSQVIVTCIYLLYNSIYTSMHLAREWSGYAVRRKALRVTAPYGVQRSTYWLHLPYSCALPLTIASGLLHWLVSQSLFLARITSYDGEEESDLSAVGFSLAPTLGAIIVGSLMVVMLVGMGFRKLDKRMPVAASCSVAISAAAQRPGDDMDASSFPVKWGELSSGRAKDVGHCCFTSADVVAVVPGGRYAGMWVLKGANMREHCYSSTIYYRSV